jgi:Phage tail lysozyme
MAETPETAQRQGTTDTAGGETDSMAGGASLLDMRPEAMAQRMMQLAANGSQRVMELLGLQAAANGQVDPLTVPLTDAEKLKIREWRSSNPNQVEGKPLTGDAAANALIVANAIFYARYAANGYRLHQNEVSTQCLIPEVVARDPRVALLIPMVTAKGPIINWAAVSSNDRKVMLMEQLINSFNFPVNGAAGLVGNLMAESGGQPNRVEGSREASPMRARGFDNITTDFSAEDIQNRSRADGVGPKLPGVGLAQWTSANRREGLFNHEYNGEVLGTDILFNMDAQVDYLVNEMETSYSRVYNLITGADVSVNDAADEVVYRFEVPGAILNDGRLRPRTDAEVQAVFAVRRANAESALAAYRAVHPAEPVQGDPVTGPR